MAAFRFHGRVDATPRRPALAQALPDAIVQPKLSADIQRARSGQTPTRVEPAADDIVELELDDGLLVWMRADDLERDLGLTRSRDAGDTLELPAALPLGAASRGLGGWIIKGLNLFGIDVPGTITEFVAKRVEGRLTPGPGLYRCTREPPSRWRPAGGRGDGAPTLVLLHGTASSTYGSFSGLWRDAATPPIQRLLDHYGGRVLAFQHRTLTQSPIENALDLARRLDAMLPKGAELHLLSHSRGGLIGELLARGMRVGGSPFDTDDLDLFSKAHARDVAALRELRDLLRGQRFRLARFVRVACPARGTTLADGRLDRYFGVLTNLVGMIPGLRGNPIFEGLTSLLAGVLKKRTDPDELPGLEAMMPGSALVRMLNRPEVRTEADLHVVGGDLDGAGPWDRLKTLASDFFYREDHDLVVNTPSMLGGAERAAGVIPYWIDAGAGVTHFHYFTRDDTTNRVMSALTSSTPSADFRELAAKPFAVGADDYRKRAAAAQPVVFLVPGIMGSTLSVQGSRIWLDIPNLARGRLTDVAIDARGVVAGLLVARAYQDVVQFLSATHEVVAFPYDWRRSIVTAASNLQAALDVKLDETAQTKQPIRILAHSMGGLVVRAMIASPRGRKTWQRLCNSPGARLVMLGTPNGGSHAMAAMLLGRDALAKKLALLDLKHGYADLLRVLAAFPGVLELLPHGGTLDLFDAASWSRLFDHDVPDAARGLFSSSSVASSKSAGFAWTKPDPARLKEARAVRDLLRSSPIDPARMIYVAGCAPETAIDVTIDPGADERHRVRVLATSQGDGRVPWGTGIPPELATQTYFMDAAHGDLAATKEYFPALLDLLTTGATTKLSRVPPVSRGRRDDRFELREPLPAFVPDVDDLTATAMGGRPRRRRERDVRRVAVRVVHENLSQACCPVMVGHYEQDMLVSAEARLDAQLDGRLSEIFRMGLYPGPLGTATAVLNEPDAARGIHPGAIIVGLGIIGDLTPGDLQRTLSAGFTTFGAERSGQERRRRQRERSAGEAATTLDMPITTVLIGSGEAGVSLAEALRAMLNAVRHANERLALGGGGARKTASGVPVIRIDRVDIFEVYQDRAIQALRALHRLAEASDVREAFEIEEVLVEGTEGTRRASFDDPDGWWRRIRIAVESDGSFKFEVMTDRAQAPRFMRPTQWALADRLLDRARRSTSADPELGYTLFEHLLPPELKTYVSERRLLAFVLDPRAASFPWELMRDRYDVGALPLAVETGMIRQLLGPGSAVPRRALGDCALVIGNPVVRDGRFRPLAGAEAEARSVAKLLTEGGYSEVATLLGEDADPESVLVQLHARPWRILHVAAHGVFEFALTEGGPKRTGIVLDGGIVLDPAEFKQLRMVPELAFINCCHLGGTEGDAEPNAVRYDHLAANVATELIRIGVRVVVAAGWEVDDAAARAFAETFYGRMLSGARFGDAVAEARRRVHREHGHTNTWGAYQCYGDPGFTLRAAPGSRSTWRPVAPLEAALALDAIAKNSRQAETADQRDAQQRLLEELIGMCRQAWLEGGAVASAIGTAYGELGQFGKAIEFYQRATAASHADVSLAAIEQLANLVARAEGAAPREYGTARDLLRGLVQIGKTGERFAILGGLEKRRAIVARGPGRRRALDAMTKAYADAYRIKSARKDPDPWYPLANEIAGGVVLSWRQPARSRAARATAADLKRLAGLVEAVQGTGFWERAIHGDVALLQAMFARRFAPRTIDTIRDAWDAAFRRGASARQRRSVLDQVLFFEAMLETEAPSTVRARLAPGLRELREWLAPGDGPAAT